MRTNTRQERKFGARPTYDGLRAAIAEVIAEERERSSMTQKQSLAGLTKDEVTADRIITGIRECRFFVCE